jgi:hypothetical protein
VHIAFERIRASLGDPMTQGEEKEKYGDRPPVARETSAEPCGARRQKDEREAIDADEDSRKAGPRDSGEVGDERVAQPQPHVGAEQLTVVWKEGGMELSGDSRQVKSLVGSAVAVAARVGRGHHREHRERQGGNRNPCHSGSSAVGP